MALEVRADASYVVNGGASVSSRGTLSKGCNGDLWQRFSSMHAVKEGFVAVTKVKAHRSPKEMFVEAHSIQDFLGNHLADVSAGAAAEKSLHGNPAARTVERWEQRGFLIARRLALIEAWHWANNGPTRHPRPEPLPAWSPPTLYDTRQLLHHRVEEQGHVLRIESGRTVCGRCHKRRGTSNYRYWADHPCVAVSGGTRTNYAGGGAAKRSAPSAADGTEGTWRRRRGPGEEQQQQQQQHQQQQLLQRRAPDTAVHDRGGSDLDHDGADHVDSGIDDYGIGDEAGDHFLACLGAEAGVTDDAASGNKEDSASICTEGHGSTATPVANSGASGSAARIVAGGITHGARTPADDDADMDAEVTVGPQLQALAALRTSYSSPADGADVGEGVQPACKRDRGTSGQPPRDAANNVALTMGDEAETEAGALTMGFTSEEEDVFGHGGGLDQVGAAEVPRGRGSSADRGEAPCLAEVSVASGPHQRQWQHGHQRMGIEDREVTASASGSADGGRTAGDDPAPTVALRRRITGKRAASSAGLAPPPPAAAGRNIADHAEDDGLISARERRRMVAEQLAETRRRRRAETAVVQEAWGDASTAISAAAFVALEPTDAHPPFNVGDGHDLVACGGFYGCVRCAAVVGWHGHHRLAAPCRGSCPAGSRGPIRLLSHGRLPHRQREFYGRD